MATSSIFASFNINDAKTAEAFVEAIEKSEKDSKSDVLTSASVHITDKSKIKELLRKRKENG